MSTTLYTISVPPKSGQPPQGVIVLLHGWGSNCQDIAALANYMDLPDYQLMFPDAPFPHPYNPVGKMWYALPQDYSFLGKPEFGDRADLSTSRQRLIEFLTHLTQTSNVPLSRTILGGFSQGGAMTLDVGVRLPLAGLMILSGYLHAPLQPPQTPLPPTLMIHGRQDQVVPLPAAHQARARLQALGVTPQYQEYDMGHEIQPMVLNQMQSFVKELLPSLNKP
ncbi:alpha/beta hydrolase [Phormidium sp. CLA17]|uniref:alpha/beta hydrolase n=1 Tax=Leptolyngbya sp. Cla-17 TaxID=2803751 RepID=UPI001492B5B3|nr:alpha/beta hydrolase [Leptolyngbya sp. Cla-17]MBM0743303.1 alpha/beta hydrolase [Leptolyngbya sp. Cla-17]